MANRFWNWINRGIDFDKPLKTTDNRLKALELRVNQLTVYSTRLKKRLDAGGNRHDQMQRRGKARRKG